MFDNSSTMVKATSLIIGAGGIALEGGVHFFGEVIIAFGAFTLAKFDRGELHPLKETVLVDKECLALYPSLGLLGANLEVLARQIWLGLGMNLTLSIDVLHVGECPSPDRH